MSEILTDVLASTDANAAGNNPDRNLFAENLRLQRLQCSLSF